MEFSNHHQEDVMKKKMLVGLVVLLAIWIPGACSTEPDPEYLAYLLSRTQTAMSPTPTYTPEVNTRCDLFADEELSVVLYSINPWDTNLKMYVKFKNGVIGKEDGTDDGLSWDYSVTIGEVESMGCDIFEGETYAGRLYCILPLPPEYRNAAKPAAVRVNGCPEDLLSIPQLSLLVEKPVAGSGGSGDGSSGGSDKKLSVQFTKLCSVKPEPICSTIFSQWCDCMGGTFTCLGEPGGGNPATCDLP
jgi:hypothetical protein